MQKRNVVAGTVLAAIMGITVGYEGVRTTAYRDAGGVPTICMGETLGVVMGQTATLQECKDRHVQSLIRHNEPLTKLPQMPVNVHIAVLDWTYNVGTGAAQRSTLWKYLQASQWEKACGEFTKWRFVAGKDCSKDRSCTGVWTRRVDERDLCLGKITPNQLLQKLGQPVVAEME
ncbi:MAG: lysozyme [Plesiomonas sp.]